jgi:hypothetical protein
MSISRASLGRGPAVITYGGATLYTRDDIVPRHAPVWNPVMTSMYGEVDKYKRDLVIKVLLRLWGAWESLSVLFPAYALSPTIGASLYGAADSPLVLLARNGDKITYANAQITKLSDLYLGVDSELFQADVEFTALLSNATEPEAANAYYTIATGQAYADNAFAKTNFKRVRFTGAWGAKTGWTTIVPQKGVNINWTLDLRSVPVDGYGTVDMTVANFIGAAKCIPIGPTLTQLEAQANAQGSAMGTLLSAAAADLLWTGSAISILLKNAGAMEHGYAWGIEPLRVGEFGWSTTRGFAAGVPADVAQVDTGS